MRGLVPAAVPVHIKQLCPGIFRKCGIGPLLRLETSLYLRMITKLGGSHILPTIVGIAFLALQDSIKKIPGKVAVVAFGLQHFDEETAVRIIGCVKDII